MQVETCRIGGALRLGDRSLIEIHSLQSGRVCVGAAAPVGTTLILGGASVHPLFGTLGLWTYFFSLSALRRFILGRFEVRIWFPGELVPDASGCQDWLHIGVAPSCPRSALVVSLPTPVTPARPLLQVEDDGGRLLFGRP